MNSQSSLGVFMPLMSLPTSCTPGPDDDQQNHLLFACRSALHLKPLLVEQSSIVVIVIVKIQDEVCLTTYALCQACGHWNIGWTA